MKKRNLIFVFALVVISIPILLVYLTIFNSTDCDQLVIDTYELHSDINIPQVESMNCYFDEALKTRISVFDLKGFVDLEDFDLAMTFATTSFRGFDLLAIEERPSKQR